MNPLVNECGHGCGMEVFALQMMIKIGALEKNGSWIQVDGPNS